jgi:hypothetical protein
MDVSGLLRDHKRGDIKILIGVLMDMLRNMSLSCWSVSDSYGQNSRIIGDHGESCVQMQGRKIDDSEAIIKRNSMRLPV